MDALELESEESGGGRRQRRGRRGRGGRTERDPPGGPVPPSDGKNNRRRRSRRRRGAPIAGVNRRKRLSRAEVEELQEYFQRVNPRILGALYRGLGGQPSRVPEPDRLVQLTVRALAQPSRMTALVKSLHERERTALATLLQCGGLAYASEFYGELSLSLGGHERDWQRVLLALADKGLVAANDDEEEEFYFLVPEPLVDPIVESLATELTLATFTTEEMKVRDARPFSPRLDFTIATLATYVDQRPPRMTQQQEVYKTHKEEMDRFFAQVWDAGSELFHFHIRFLMRHGLVEYRGDHLALSREIMEEWLSLDPQDQRDLLLRSLDDTLPYAEGVMVAVDSGRGEWVPERPLSALYRRWLRGEDWRRRFQAGTPMPGRTLERESFSFAPLVQAGMLQLGEWGQEKFYRLTERGKSLLHPPEEDGFDAFYLTPSFEIMAPAGLSPATLFRIGEIAELTGCDRANTYKITEVSIEQALNRGWRRESVLDFLRENSQTGLPENVEQTLKGWMGHHGDVEFHEVTLLTVHKSRIRRLESLRELKPYLLHRFTPGLYAVDKARLGELRKLMEQLGFSPTKDISRYPASAEQVQARERLLGLVAAAREASEDPLSRAHAADTQPEDLHPVPGSQPGKGSAKRKKRDLPPRVSPREARIIADRAISSSQQLELLYVARDGSRVTCRVQPERLAITPGGDEVLVARDVQANERRSYKLTQIERARPLARK